MDRFFVSPEQVDGDNIYIKGPDVKHILGALRLEESDKLEIVCEGEVYTTKISEIKKDEIILEILEIKKGINEPEMKINLYQGLAKGSRMDYVIQKGTEIGITTFYSVSTDRSIVRINNEKKKKNRIERWQKIADESGKQCKRDILPKVEDILEFDDLLKMLKNKKNILIPYEAELDNGIKEKLKDIEGQEIHIVIGPEGGFSKREIEKLKEIGGVTVSLGPRILRTETAGLITAAIIFYEFGDI